MEDLALLFKMYVGTISPDALNVLIQESIQTLVHAFHCMDRNHPSCQKMKRLVLHMTICKLDRPSDCPICKQLMALFCYHAKHCHGKESNCTMPFYGRTKQKLWLHHVQKLQKRMAALEVRVTATDSSPPLPSETNTDALPTKCDE